MKRLVLAALFLAATVVFASSQSRLPQRRAALHQIVTAAEIAAKPCEIPGPRLGESVSSAWGSERHEGTWTHRVEIANHSPRVKKFELVQDYVDREGRLLLRHVATVSVRADTESTFAFDTQVPSELRKHVTRLPNSVTELR